VLVGTASALVILALAVMPLLTPLFIHAALDAADSAGRLGVATAETHQLSDRTVAELVWGPATFSFAGPSGEPFYDAAEAGHLRDARLVLWALLIAAGVSAVLIGVRLARDRDRRPTWRAIARGALVLAVAMAAIGVFFLLAFDAAFELFHRIFFPGGNWAFDPTTERLVQLYPIPFWQLTSAALGALVIALALATWALGRRVGRKGELS
jgi:integral membrane protein (TIGR01906 family)